MRNQMHRIAVLPTLPRMLRPPQEGRQCRENVVKAAGKCIKKAGWCRTIRARGYTPSPSEEPPAASGLAPAPAGSRTTKSAARPFRDDARAPPEGW